MNDQVIQVPIQQLLILSFILLVGMKIHALCLKISSIHIVLIKDEINMPQIQNNPKTFFINSSKL